MTRITLFAAIAAAVISAAPAQAIQFQIQMLTQDLQNAENVRSQAQQIATEVKKKSK